jgi:phosphoenolpyruvate carboxylase
MLQRVMKRASPAMTPDRPLPREPLDFAESDTLLRDDVRRPGCAMVGTMLAEQVSPEFLQQVEALRASRPPAAAGRAGGCARRSAWSEVALGDAEALVRVRGALRRDQRGRARASHASRRRRDTSKGSAAAGQPEGPALLECAPTVSACSGIAGIAAADMRESVFTAHPGSRRCGARAAAEGTRSRRRLQYAETSTAPRTPPERGA